MTDINKTGQSYIDSIRWSNDELAGRAKKGARNDELTQEDFFALITQQLAAQDPFKPSDNSDMVAQMVAMSTTESLGEMNTTFAELREVMTSNQALQASSLIGKKVLLPSQKTDFVAGEPMTGFAVLGDKQVRNLQINIEDKNGAVVHVLTYDDPDDAKSFQITKTGNVEINWDGKDENGNDVAEGIYNFKAVGVESNGKTAAEYPVVMHGRVESVTLGTKDTPSAVRIRALGGFQLKDVLEIGQN